MILILVLQFVLFLFTRQAEGYARIAVSANLAENVQLTTPGWRKITSWVAPSSSGHVMSSTKLSDGEFKAPISGLYSLYTTVTFSGADEGLFKLMVLINNDFQSNHPGLQSSFENAVSFESLSVFGAVRLQAGNTLAVFVYSQSDKNWILIGNSETTFSVEFGGFYAGIPGYSSYLTRQYDIKDTVSPTSLLKWKAFGLPGLFISRTGFSQDAGSFSPICKGVYQISANVQFLTGSSGGIFSLSIALNEDSTGSTMTREMKRSNATFTITLSLTLSLEQGDMLTIQSMGDTPYTVTTNSGFSGLKLNNGGNIPGFSSVVLLPITGNGRTWVSIPIPAPTSLYGQFDAVPGSITGGRFYNPINIILTVSGLIHIEAASSSSMILSLINDGSGLLVSKTGLYTTRSHESGVSSYSVAGILEVPADQPLSLYMYLANQDEYKILNGSRISVAATQQEYEAFHAAVALTTEFSSGNQYVRIDDWVLEGTGTYSFTSNFVAGKFTAGITGIYHFSTNVIIHFANGPISVVISLQGDNSKRRSLYATKGNPSDIVDSLSVSGALFVQAGQSVAVYIMVENDVSWSLGLGSTFSTVFIGQSFAVQGFSTILLSRLPIVATGWTKVTSWKDQAMDNSMFDSGGTFDPATGEFTFPETGMYLVSASIKLQDASAKGSSFQLAVVIDGEPSQYSRQNGLQDFIDNNSDPPQSNDYYSLVLSGVVYGKKDQVLTLYVHSTNDNSYSISQDSSLSIIYLTTTSGQFGSGMQIMLSDSISQAVSDATFWRKVRNWVTNRGASSNAPGIFYDGPLQEIDANVGNIKILETGLYLINVNLAINDGDDNFELAIHTTANGVSSLITKYGKTVRKKYTMKLFGVMFLTSDQTISVRVRSTSPVASWENLRAYTGLSFARIPPFVIPPSVNSALKTDISVPTVQSLWSRIRYWTTSSAPVQELSGEGFSEEPGYFTAQYTGIYLVSTSVTYMLNTAGKHVVRQKLGHNGDTSLPGSKVFESGYGAVLLIPNCEDICAAPITQLMQLNKGDTIAVYVQSPLPELHLSTSTSFTVKLVASLNPMPDSFSMELKETVTVTVYGTKQLTGWIASENGGQFYKDSGGTNDEYYISQSGLYLVSTNIQFIDLKGWAVARPSLDNIPTLSASYFSEEESSFTISVVGVLYITKHNTYTVSIETDRDQFYKLAKTSSSSLAYLGDKDTTYGYTATFNRKLTNTYIGKMWNTISSWSTSGKDWLFEVGPGFESKGSYIVPDSGYYLVGANVIISNSGNFSSPIEVVLVRNNVNDLSNGLYSRKIIPLDGRITLQVHGGIYLNKWDFVQLQFMTHETLELSFEQESTYTMVKLGDDITSVPCVDNGPNIVGRLVPDDTRKKVGTDIEWQCFATGDSPSYQWIKDLKNIPGASSSMYELTNLAIDDTGDYICSAEGYGVKAYSNIAKLTVFDPRPTILNPSDLNTETPENGATQLVLIHLKAKAESFESDATEMTYEIVGGDDDNTFSLSPTRSFTGTDLSRVKTLDRETIPEYRLQVRIINQALQGEFLIVNITIVVTDLNDNPPIFEHQSYTTTVYENTTLFTKVFSVKATDDDIGENQVITYELIPGTPSDFFMVERETGNILLSGQLDRETTPFYVLYIKGEDGVHTTYAEVTVYVGDVNEHAPYFLVTSYFVEVPETTIPGNAILTLKAHDKDSGLNAKLTYTIVHGDNKGVFAVSELGQLVTRDSLDYETNSSFTLTIAVRDNGKPILQGSNNATVQVHIHNTNDNGPRFDLPEYEVDVVENSMVIEPQLTISATDPDGGKREGISPGVLGVICGVPQDKDVEFKIQV